MLAGLGEWGQLFRAIRDQELEQRQALAEEESRRAAKAAEEEAKTRAAEIVKADKVKAAAALAEEAAVLGNSEEAFRKAIEDSDPVLRTELAKRILEGRRAADTSTKRAGPY